MPDAHDGIDLFRGGQLLRNAAEAYGRALTPEEYWWLGVGLAAATLAELGGREYAARRIQQLLGRLGGPGDPEEWFEQFHNELAALDAEGLLWPLYQRDERGKMARTDAVVAAGFDADAGWALALAHLAIARSVLEERQEAIPTLAEVIADLIEGAPAAEHLRRVQAALGMQPEGAEEP